MKVMLFEILTDGGDGVVAWSEVSQAWTLQYGHTASKTMRAEGNEDT
jgi:hypothetical protein